MAVRLARIDIFPVKSFDGVSVERVRVLPAGGLENDRRFAVVDAQGKLVNGKRTPLVHTLGFSFDEALSQVTVTDRLNGQAETFALSLEESPVLEARLSAHFCFPVCVKEDRTAGFPDDTLASGPTVIGAETLATVADWFRLSADNARRRFRANLSLEGGGAFWEDRLFAAPGETVTFRIGGVMFFGTNPCARCVVPSRDPDTGEAIPAFAKAFAERRRSSLPAWAEPEAFDHYFRLAVNTRLFAPADGGEVRVGDPVEILGI